MERFFFKSKSIYREKKMKKREFLQQLKKGLSVLEEKEVEDINS